MFMRVIAFALAAGFAIQLAAQDVLTIGSVSAPRGSVVEVPVYVRDVAGTTLGEDQAMARRIRGMTFKVAFSPASAVSSISFARGGILTAAPLYERVVSSSNAIAYLGSFLNDAIAFTTNAPVPGQQIGSLTVTISAAAEAGSSLSLTIDATTATLSNQTGTTVETTTAGLGVANGTIAIEAAPTATSLTSSANPSAAGQSVTFTATVTSSLAGTLTGNVDFMDGTTTLGTGPLDAGQATFTTSGLTAGTHAMSARYSGNTNYSASVSAVVEQTVLPPFGAPSGLTATATSTTKVLVSWNAVSGADHYVLYRRTAGGAFGPITSTPSPTFNDTAVSAGTTYLYYVRAVTAGGAMSENSAVDAATTILFTEDPLVAGTIVRAVHLSELRAAVNAFRAAVGIGSFTFTHSSLAGSIVRAMHVEELRAALSPARSAGGVSAVVYTDSPLVAGTVVKAVHLQELRSAVK